MGAEKLQRFQKWRRRRGAAVIQRAWRRHRFAGLRERRQLAEGGAVLHSQGATDARADVFHSLGRPVDAAGRARFATDKEWAGTRQEISILRLSEMQQKFVQVRKDC